MYNRSLSDTLKALENQKSRSGAISWRAIRWTNPQRARRNITDEEESRKRRTVSVFKLSRVVVVQHVCCFLLASSLLRSDYAFVEFCGCLWIML